ncbi:MBL fold metallo-hydrolase [Streptomyces sp. NBC_00988]|uniref:MBL fold metallo-hydrolase n=1 Tax=Streptomyces sp. NBC_00988 TaxID=2903704 RepID=UPI00386D5C83|nr:MBL fold metallo-hydrolase [Streptomyces sp. NBC_00988]
MNLTHFGHACVLAAFETSEGSTRLLLDPGTYASGFEDARDLDAILFTHEHPDHLDVDRLHGLVKANPGVRLIAAPGASARLGETGIAHEAVSPGATFSVKGVSVAVLGGEHAVIHPQLPRVSNNAYLIDGRLLHPGDALVIPPGPVEVLLVPAGGPWMKISEGIDYLREVAPGTAVPIHQAGLADAHQQLHHQLLRTLAPEATDIQVLELGVPTGFPGDIPKNTVSGRKP